jgi:malonyl-CoA/methylmalonyl-CoA synthetase
MLLHVLPVHHNTGLGTSFFPWLVAGACIEFRSGSFSLEWIWNRWLQGGITVFSGVPTIYMRLKWYYEKEIAQLPTEQKERFIIAANQLRILKSGSRALQTDVQIFWTQLRNGRPILTRYGAT